MVKWLGLLKPYRWPILIGSLTVLVLVARASGARSVAQKIERKILRAQVKRNAEVAKKDVEIVLEARSRRTDALKEIEDTGDSTIFRDPNSMRRNRNED